VITHGLKTSHGCAMIKIGPVIQGVRQNVANANDSPPHNVGRRTALLTYSVQSAFTMYNADVARNDA